MPTSDAPTDAMTIELAQPPAAPRDINRFTSNDLFGQPGIYPDGTPMSPAAGIAPDVDTARSRLAEVLLDRGREDVLARFDDPALAKAAPEPVVRAALLSLAGTIAEPLLDSFPGSTTTRVLHLGSPASPGRIVGPATDGPHHVSIVNRRYRAEHPALIAPSLAHDLLWSPHTGHAAEAVLHALVAMVHLQSIIATPALAGAGTELARRQNSLAFTLLNSRQPGEADIRLMAPDGPGTIPGGNPDLSTPDFWSIPFGAPEREVEAPKPLERVVDRLVDPAVARPLPRRFDNALGEWLSAQPSTYWLPRADQARAVALLS